MSEMIKPVCPRCGRQDTVTKVSELVEFGTMSLGKMPSPKPLTLHAADSDRALTELESRSKLAQRLFVPDELWREYEDKEAAQGARPVNRSSRTAGIVLSALAGFFLINQLDPGWAWLGLLLGMLLGGLFFNYLPNRAVKKARTLARLSRDEAQRRYAALYYCTRDDLVFIPEEGLNAAAGEMLELLYRR